MPYPSEIEYDFFIIGMADDVKDATNKILEDLRKYKYEYGP